MDIKKYCASTAGSRPVYFERCVRWHKGKLVLPVRRIVLRTGYTADDGYIRCRPIQLNQTILEQLRESCAVPEPFKIFVYDRPTSSAALKRDGIVYNAGELKLEVYVLYQRTI